MADSNVAASSSSHHVLKYDVFLSFRGEDTRWGFVTHLYEALRTKGIYAYKDDESLRKGEEISPALVKAIEDSKISIVVFSQDYASSRWCLGELVHILRCKTENGQIVLPIFYGVNPSHVRNQKESYARAFVAHEERFRDDVGKVNKWRSALREAGDISGWDSSKYGSEIEFLGKIVQDILEKLSSISPTEGDELESTLVGMEQRLKNIEELLRVDSPDVRIVGIWGMGGIGKTTLAEETQKRFASRFESCFFKDVSDEVNKCGLIDLKKEFYAALLNDKNIDMNSSFNKVRLQRRKVLVVVDNVNDLQQVEQIIGKFPLNKSQFGQGSKILITSRNEKSFQMADATYEVDSLDSDDAFKLFYQHAFRTDPSKIPDFVKLSDELVKYAKGNPLALTVLGSHLHSRPFKEWECVLNKLKEAPPKEIYDVLKISYDTLDRGQQSAFLDIAYFRKCWGLLSAIEILEDDYYCIDISILIEKCLIARRDGRLWMHDLMKEMAWEIMRQESTELEQRSRLWTPEDVSRVLEANKGSANIQAIYLDIRKITSNLNLEPTIFGKMCNLRFLYIFGLPFGYKLNFDQGLGSLPDTLRYLIWRFYPLKSLPSNFRPQNLVILRMPFSKLTKLWDGVQHLGNLKHLDLSMSHGLIELPDLSHASKLEMINLNCCIRLCRLPKMPMNLKRLDVMFTAVKELGTSLQSLEKLECLELTQCEHLESHPNNCLPRSIQGINAHNCDSLKMINICGCDSLKKLSVSCCKSLEVIATSGCTSLQVIDAVECPSLKFLNIINIKSIEKIDVSECTALKRIDVSGCISLDYIKADECTSLDYIKADGCTSLREFSIIGCTSLKYFTIKDFESLRIIEARGCKSLTEIDVSGCTSMTKIDLCGCTLLEIIDARGCTSLRKFLADECTSLKKFIYIDENRSKSWVTDELECPSFSFTGCLKLEQSARDDILFLFQSYLFGSTIALNDDEDKFRKASASVCYIGDVIPEWFNHQSKGFSITISLPQSWYNTNFIGFAASIVFGFEDASTICGFSCPNIKCSLKLKTHCGPTPRSYIAYCPLTSFSCEDTQEWYSKDHTLMWHVYTYGFDDDEESTINNVVEASFTFFFNYEKDKEDDEDEDEGEEEDEKEDEDDEEDGEEDEDDEEDEEENNKEDDGDDSFNEEIKAIVKRCGIRMMYLQEAKDFGFRSVEKINV